MTDEKSQRHKERMQQRKEIVDAKIARATEDRGVLIVLTGDGKGKSSCSGNGIPAWLCHPECRRRPRICHEE
mgnify:CR=1 FL=1